MLKIILLILEASEQMKSNLGDSDQGPPCGLSRPERTAHPGQPRPSPALWFVHWDPSRHHSTPTLSVAPCTPTKGKVLLPDLESRRPGFVVGSRVLSVAFGPPSRHYWGMGGRWTRVSEEHTHFDSTGYPHEH